MHLLPTSCHSPFLILVVFGLRHREQQVLPEFTVGLRMQMPTNCPAHLPPSPSPSVPQLSPFLTHLLLLSPPGPLSSWSPSLLPSLHLFHCHVTMATSKYLKAVHPLSFPWGKFILESQSGLQFHFSVGACYMWQVVSAFCIPAYYDV